MSEASTLEKVVLYCLPHRKDEGDVPVPLLLERLDPKGLGYTRFGMLCHVVGLTPPTSDDVLDALQRLLDEGYADVAFDYQPRIDPKDIREVANADQNDQWHIGYRVSGKGTTHNESFLRFVESEEANRKKLEYLREYVDRETAELPFRVVIPDYLPEGLDPIPDVLVENCTASLIYEAVTIEETNGDFAESYDVSDQRTYEEIIEDVVISVAERQMSSVLAGLELEWDQSGTRIRLNVKVQEPVPATQAEFKYAVIDDEVREEARKIARSMIEQVEK